jgi:hypothetical protein
MTIPLWVQGEALQGGSIPFFSSLLEGVQGRPVKPLSFSAVQSG